MAGSITPSGADLTVPPWQAERNPFASSFATVAQSPSPHQPSVSPSPGPSTDDGNTPPSSESGTRRAKRPKLVHERTYSEAELAAMTPVERRRQLNRDASARCRMRKLEAIAQNQAALTEINATNDTLRRQLDTIQNNIRALQAHVKDHQSKGCAV